MAEDPVDARNAFGDIAPQLAAITDKVLFGQVWEDKTLSPRDRSLVTIANLTALYRQNELPFHIAKGLENRLTEEEIIAAISHTAFYAGWPTAMTAIQIARTVFAKTKD
jgi:4-carboxymuconolactone decarboxylase